MEENLTGKEINGYQIGLLLGRGGMGEVYVATPLDKSDPVAIKFLRPEYVNDVKVQQRFLREIRILGALKHDNIVQIYDNGIINQTQLFYTMELITGMPLSKMMEQHKFSPLVFWEILRQVCAGLGFAHENKVVHRDIKPENIFVETKGKGLYVVLADFGLGKQEGTDRTMTEMGTSLGTPYYMAPETIRGNTPNLVSDIYAVAVMTYEALLGRRLFPNLKRPHQVAMAHVTQPVDIPRELVSDFPMCLEDVLLKGLEKMPEDRYQTIGEFAEDYYDCLQTLTAEERTKVYHVTDED